MTMMIVSSVLFSGAAALTTFQVQNLRSHAHTKKLVDAEVRRLLVRRPGHNRRRTDALATELGPALELIVGHLRIGRNFMSALDEVSETVPEPLRSLLREVVSEARLGSPVHEVLQTVADRENERHLSIVASALGLQARLGGSLVEILETVITTIEEEDRLRRDIRSLTADGRLSAQILLAMPPVMLVVVSLISPGYAEPLLSDPLGRAMSVTALGLALVGWRWLRRLSSPRVIG